MHILAACLSLAATNGAAAFVGKCLLEVDGKPYLDGPCNIEIKDGGSFTVGVGDESRSEYFAYVTVDAGARKADGFWNAARGESHADTALGTLSRHGACWTNERAKVCAWSAD